MVLATITLIYFNMKYLLSTGEITTDHIKSIIDNFTTRLSLYKNEIPFSSNNGFDKTYSGLNATEVIDKLRLDIPSIASQVSNLIEVKNISLERDGFKISVTINQDNYELSIGN